MIKEKGSDGVCDELTQQNNTQTIYTPYCTPKNKKRCKSLICSVNKMFKAVGGGIEPPRGS